MQPTKKKSMSAHMTGMEKSLNPAAVGVDGTQVHIDDTGVMQRFGKSFPKKVSCMELWRSISSLTLYVPGGGQATPGLA